MDWRDVKAVLFYSALFGAVVLALATQSAVKQRAAQEASDLREASSSPVTVIAATDIRRLVVRNGR